MYVEFVHPVKGVAAQLLFTNHATFKRLNIIQVHVFFSGNYEKLVVVVYLKAEKTFWNMVSLNNTNSNRTILDLVEFLDSTK